MPVSKLEPKLKLGTDILGAFMGQGSVKDWELEINYGNVLDKVLH